MTSRLPPSCQHILMFAALLAHDSLAVVAAACAAMAACLRHDSEAGGVQTAQPDLLLQLAPSLGTALRRLSLAEEATPPAAMDVALHMGLAIAGARSEPEDAGRDTATEAAIHALAPVAMDFARFAASQAEALMAAAEAAAEAAEAAAAFALDDATDVRLLAAAVLVRGAKTSSLVDPQTYPPSEVFQPSE